MTTAVPSSVRTLQRGAFLSNIVHCPSTDGRTNLLRVLQQDTSCNRAMVSCRTGCKPDVMAQASGARATRVVTATIGGAEEGGPAGAARMRLAAARALGRLAARMPQGAPI